MIRDLMRIAKCGYSPEAIKECEAYVLKILDWDLKLLTPLHSLRSLVNQGIIFEDDTIPASQDTERSGRFQWDDRALRGIRRYAEFFGDMCAQGIFSLLTIEAVFCGFAPGMVSASCVLASRYYNKVEPLWNKKLAELLRYEKTQINDCFEYIKKYFPPNNLQNL